MLLKLNVSRSSTTPVQYMFCPYWERQRQAAGQRSIVRDLLLLQGTVVVRDPWRLADGVDLNGPHLVVLPHSLGMLPLQQRDLAFGTLSRDISCWQASELARRMVLHMCSLLSSCAALAL